MVEQIKSKLSIFYAHFKMDQSLSLFSLFIRPLKHFVGIKSVDFSRIQTRIVRVESKRADHLTTLIIPLRAVPF